MFQSGLKPVYFDEIENYHDLVEVLGRNEQWYTLGERLGYIQSDLDNIKKGMYPIVPTNNYSLFNQNYFSRHFKLYKGENCFQSVVFPE